MGLTLTFSYKNFGSSPKSESEILKFLQDPKKCIEPHFPGLHSIQMPSPELVDWKFKKLSYGGYDLVIAFSTRLDVSAHSVVMVPITGKGNAGLKTTWSVDPSSGGKTKFSLQADLTIQTPLPGIIKNMVQPVVESEMKKIFDTYFGHVEKALQ